MSQEVKMENPMQIFVLHTLPGCSGCRICMKVCSMRHEQVVNPEVSRIMVYQFFPGPIDVPVVCQYCSDRPCVEACPSEALSYDGADYLMKVDKSLCLGKSACGLCLQACIDNDRGGCITFHPGAEDYAQVCDLCGGDPECIKHCPSDTLSFLPPMRGPTGVGSRTAKPPELIASRIADQLSPAKKTLEEE